MALFNDKIANLRRSLDSEETRTAAAEVLAELIDEIVIYTDEAGGSEAEVVASTARLVMFAQNDKSPPVVGRRGGLGSSIMVVAGARNGRCTTPVVVDI